VEPNKVLELSLLRATSNGSSIENENILEMIQWPYWIVGIGHVAFSFGYIAMNYLPYQMPSKLKLRGIV